MQACSTAALGLVQGTKRAFHHRSERCRGEAGGVEQWTSRGFDVHCARDASVVWLLCCSAVELGSYRPRAAPSAEGVETDYSRTAPRLHRPTSGRDRRLPADRPTVTRVKA